MSVPSTIGDYEIEALLGEGGMAAVYRARHKILDMPHALKVLDPSYRANPEARQRFLDEAKIQAKHLNHRNIVKVTNIVATPEHAALVMELVEGSNLESLIGKLQGQPAETIRIMLAILDAVEHAHHAGVIHRDLKPANVLLAREDDTLIPKVTDFGIAKVTAMQPDSSKKSTRGDARMGTLQYMSPEQVKGAKYVTKQSDIFSLGVILYELATGELPFAGDNDFDLMRNIVDGNYRPPEAVVPRIDARIAAAIKKALAQDPVNRFATCAEMARALRAPDDDRGVPILPAAVASRSRALVIGLVAGGLVLAGVVTAVAIKMTSPSSPTLSAGSAAGTVPAQPGPQVVLATVPAPVDAQEAVSPEPPSTTPAAAEVPAAPATANAPVPRPTPAPRPAASADACDELGCGLKFSLESGRIPPCCEKYRQKFEDLMSKTARAKAKADEVRKKLGGSDDGVRDAGVGRAPVVPSDAPTGHWIPAFGNDASTLEPSLTRAQISTGIASVKSKIVDCGIETDSPGGKVKVKVTVGPDGAVRTVSVEEANFPVLGECVRNVVRTARFATTQTGGSFTYPFTF